ncbi:MAG: hypothetical protein HYV27_08950 [Candidatus Hydrogenedentes bacterium]|nr:hypothetical protein [Candidatus Hydrogenedentota bacterium]
MGWVVLVAALLHLGASVQGEEGPALARAQHSATVAGASLSKVHRWLHEVALKRIDPATGLYRADEKWNYRDTAADCYPFLAWAAFVVDKDALNGPVREILHREAALCNTIDRIPVPWDFENDAPATDTAPDEIVFQASEYVKDGLAAIVEATGPDEWFDRMRGIVDDLWKHAAIDTPAGKICSENLEVNGDHLLVLPRLYGMTGDTRYLDWADRISDYYLSDPGFLPPRLRDHGCEIIGGLGLLHAVEVTARPEEAAARAPHLKRIYDAILAQGCNEDGIMYNHLTKRDGNDGMLSDGWGYNYVGYLCYDLATNASTYAPAVRRTLGNLAKPLYRDYPWERDNIDGWADSIEGAIYLLNRVPVAEGAVWVDQEMASHVARTAEPEHLWGTMKLESNGVRTTLLHALMHTQGLIARPWQQGLELGAAPLEGGGVQIAVRSAQPYSGHLEFDLPRHRLYIGFEKDWPRINTLPEWFTVDPGRSYTVQMNGGALRLFTGAQLHHGLAVKVAAGEETAVVVRPDPLLAQE